MPILKDMKIAATFELITGLEKLKCSKTNLHILTLKYLEKLLKIRHCLHFLTDQIQ